MKILVIGRTLDRPESRIILGLHERGHKLLILTESEGQYVGDLRRAGVRAEYFRVAHRLDLAAMVRLRRLVRQERINVVYALSNAALSAANVGLVGLPARIVAYRGTVGNLSWLDPFCWLTFLNPRISRVVCVSKAVERYLLGLGLPHRRVATIYKGHDPSWYQGTSPTTRRELGIPEDAFVLGCTAVIRPGKGVEVLLRACAALDAELPNLHLLLVGSIKYPLVESLFRSFPARERLHLTGFRQDAARLAPLMDVSVLCSTRGEGFPKSVVVAMVQGVPVIVSSLAGLPELVGNGEAGVLVPPGDAATLADAIRLLALDPGRRATLAEAGRKRVVERFRVQDSILQMHRLFSSVLLEELPDRYPASLVSGT